MQFDDFDANVSPEEFFSLAPTDEDWRDSITFDDETGDWFEPLPSLELPSDYDMLDDDDIVF